MDEHFSERFWRIVCEADRALYTVIILDTVFLVLLLFSLPFVGEQVSVTVLWIDFSIVLSTLALASFVLLNCRR